MANTLESAVTLKEMISTLDLRKIINTMPKDNIHYPREEMPKTAAERKEIPLFSGLLKYFPRGLQAVANCSHKGNEQHNPGEKLHWDREKSTDHEDCLLRHLLDGGTMDTDRVLHSTKVAWRALAILELELEKIELNK